MPSSEALRAMLTRVHDWLANTVFEDDTSRDEAVNLDNDILAALSRRAAISPPIAPIQYRNEEAGFVEFVNEDVPYIVREIDGHVAIILDMETRNVIGYRVYDPAPAPGPITVGIKTMQMSDNREEHYVFVRCGNREVTPHKYGGAYRNRAEYEVAEWKHVLLGHPKPNLMDPKYDDPKDVPAPGPADAVSFECEDCVGTKEYGCFCAAHGAIQPGGPADAVSEAEVWQSMDNAPKDGTQFLAIREWPDGYSSPQIYEWEGSPNYWNSKRGGVCIRPDYQKDYLWCQLPGSHPAPIDGRGEAVALIGYAITCIDRDQPNNAKEALRRVIALTHPAPAPGPADAVSEAEVEAALDGAEYIPNRDNRFWMRRALEAAAAQRARK